MPLPYVNITFVSKSTKTTGELITVQKDIHKFPVIVHLKTLKVAQVNGIVMILHGLLNPIWLGMTPMVMVTSLNLMIFLMTT
jgi:hypothetical protein